MLTIKGLGGIDGAVVVDLKHFQQFSMDKTTWRASVGGGTLLGDLTMRLHDAGGRAVSHGTCPQVGIGGHATIGGLGPTSRLWGTTLDHVEEVEVVLADSSIKRCSATQNKDIFWAIKGAGACFGVVTEFVLRTEPEPTEVVQFSFAWTPGKYASMAPTFKRWQRFCSNSKLTRKFISAVTFTAVGMIIAGTYFGTKEEYEALDLSTIFPDHHQHRTIVFRDWLCVVLHWAEGVALQITGGLTAEIYTKSLAFNGATSIPDDVIDKFLTYLDETHKATLVWFVIFDLEGGAVNDVGMDETAYAHRDVLYYMQSYGVGLTKIQDTTKSFLNGLTDVFRENMSGGKDFGAYAGYVDPGLGDNGQKAYWRTNLPRLEHIKSVVDPSDVFHNPQSVRPVTKTTRDENSDVKTPENDETKIMDDGSRHRRKKEGKRRMVRESVSRICYM